MNYYQHNIGDYSAATAHLSALEDCFYRRMLDRYYQTEQPLPADRTKLLRVLRSVTKAEKDAVDAVLAEFFILSPEGYRQARCDEELSIFRAKGDVARNNGSLGGRPKKNLCETKEPITQPVISGFHYGNPDQTQQKAKQETRNKKQEPENKETPPKSPGDVIGGVLPAAPAQSAGTSLTLVANRQPGQADDVKLVFDHWRIVHAHPQAQLGDDGSKRYRAIAGRLKDGYSVDQLKSAIDGCKKSPHHMGENDRHAVYDDIELICRDTGHVDKFIQMSASNAARLGLSTAGRRTASAADAWLASQENNYATG